MDTQNPLAPSLDYKQPHRAWATINLCALERNIKAIFEHLPSSIQYIAVVKADAYGHGLSSVVLRMMQSGVSAFAVANVHEGALIREIGSGWPILVLGPILPEEYGHILRYSLTPTISSLDEVFALNTLAAQHNKQIPVHIKVDTGMGRSGVWHSSAIEVCHAIKKAPCLFLKGIYTHFKSADTSPEHTQAQRLIFSQILQQLQLPKDHNLVIHTDNSASLHSFSSAGFINAVRVGIIQYGISPYAESILSGIPVEPVLSFHTKLCLVKQVPKNTSVGYGGTYTLKHDSLLGILSAGYADGVNRLLSNQGQVIIQNQKVPIIGKISMDQTIVDLSSLKTVPKVGEIATLIGTQGPCNISASQFASWAQTIPYEVFCTLSKRVHRVYLKDHLVY